MMGYTMRGLIKYPMILSLLVMIPVFLTLHHSRDITGDPSPSPEGFSLPPWGYRHYLSYYGFYYNSDEILRIFGSRGYRGTLYKENR